VEPPADARSDHAIFAGIAERLGLGDAFTEGRDERAWMEHMWERSAERARADGFDLPSFDDFWAAGRYELPPAAEERAAWLADFRDDPAAHPLDTPSGRIEIFSDTIASFGYDDCPGHPVWLEPYERLGGALADRFPLHLVSHQPATRLHSQLDHSEFSRRHKIDDREVVRIHPDAAAERGIADGATVRLFNDRGACLAAARLDPDLAPDVLALPTGAWYAPAEPGVVGSLELGGNPNVLTRDVGTSSLAQGPSAHTCLVEIEPFTGKAPSPNVYEPPPLR
ncbi:MAG: molybdopterin dinucleotide binding domain-containing protein, partial [Ilumatobacter fluminis]